MMTQVGHIAAWKHWVGFPSATFTFSVVAGTGFYMIPEDWPEASWGYTIMLVGILAAAVWLARAVWLGTLVILMKANKDYGL